MTDTPARFNDLGIRIASAIALAVVAVAALWTGGLAIVGFVALLAGAAGWEIARMLNATQPMVVGALTGVAVALATLVGWDMRAPFIVAAVGISTAMVSQRRFLFVVAHLIVAGGALSFLLLAQGALVWLIWLVGIVVLTDVAGYFAGRVLGGPKFWPSLSPKKTWSGTIAGWIAAAIFGAVMMGPLGAGAGVIAVSVVLSFASQMGDIFQSLVKRRSGVKDASNLIPGHGGVWDRFDGMLAAALVYWPLSLLI